MTDWTKSSCAICGCEIGLGAKSMVIKNDGRCICTDCDKKMPKCPICSSDDVQFIDGGYEEGDSQGHGCNKCGHVFYIPWSQA